VIFGSLGPVFGLSTFDNLGDEASEVVFEAIDLGLEYASGSDAFIPFLLVISGDGERNMWKLVDDGTGPTVEGGVALGRHLLREIDRTTRCVALAWDGYLTYGEDRTEAVFVEGYELGRPAGVLLVQRYERRWDGSLERIGNPLLCEEPEPPVSP
jgi:hypothetical protein